MNAWPLDRRLIRSRVVDDGAHDPNNLVHLERLAEPTGNARGGDILGPQGRAGHENNR
jgi:hypothetical protein